MNRLLFFKALFLAFNLLALVGQSHGQEELKRTFQGGSGTYQLVDGTRHNAKIKVRVSEPAAVEVREQGQAEPVQLRLAQIKQLTVGRDTFVVLRNFWIPRFKQKGFRYVQDALDTVLVAEALLQRHINRGGLELLRYVGTMAENSPAMGGTSFGSTEYYSCFLFRRGREGAHRTVAGEPAPLKRFFAPVVADKPAVRDFLISTTFVELKLPRILDIYLTSKGY